ncbi:ervatamin-B-like [Senna tora]|uniref:Ervatamin-B-like n=1 Tax=Senna tora TaxID=362788 RepID=A0A834X9L3_9FABA|nr:ervatamin-B-like [Senna tora]
MYFYRTWLFFLHSLLIWGLSEELIHNPDKLGSEEDQEAVYRLVFQQWMKEHGRMYESSEESDGRFQIFQRNLKYISERNNAIKRSSKYRLGLNKFADMSGEEFRKVYLQEVKMPNTPSNFNKHYSCSSAHPPPPSLDWRDKGVVTPVKDQKRCNSCWAFAATGAIEALYAISRGKKISLSEQQLVDCDNTSYGCSFGWSYHAFQWVINNGGISQEHHYPYVAKKGTCKTTMENRDKEVKIKSYTHVSKSDNGLLCATAKQPIAVSLNATDFQFYNSGIYDGDNCSKHSTGTNHIVLIVGYDSKDGEDYWIVKNSWGEDWGMKGYMFIKRNTGLPHGPVIAADDAKPHYVKLFVQLLKPLQAHASWQAGDNFDSAYGPNATGSEDESAILDEVLVGLRVVEAAHEGPDEREWCVYGLD